ncbi:MAG: maltose ABC transporter substrate-binding protein, partial [Chloroflexi bacterium]|nr:maltose ABC transporter substrate-binding protein [Chloroflexota bacterium]
IFIGAHDWLGELVTSGIVEPVELTNPDDFLPAAVQAFSYEGQLYGMPYATENVALFYNPDLVPEPPATWDELIDIAAQLEAEGKVKQGWVMQVGDPYHFFPLMTAFGGYVFGVDENGNYNPDDVGLDSPGSLAAAEFLDKAVKDGHLVPDVDWETMHVLFESGDAAMMISGPWSLPRIRESGIPYAIATIPAETQPAQPFLGVQGFMVSAFSENKLLAEAFLNEFVATPEVMQAIFDADPRPSAFKAVREAIDDPDLAAFAAAGANGLPMPAIPEMSAVWGSWGDAITLIFNQAEDPDVAFKNAAEQIRATIAGG